MTNADSHHPTTSFRPAAERFKYCPECGEGGIQVNASRRVYCNACGFTYFINPAIAVAGIVRDATTPDQILLIRRAQEPSKGKLGMPGGFIDAGESAEEALIREISEEIGVEASIERYIGSYPNRYNHGGIAYEVLDLFYLCQAHTPLEQARIDETEVSGLVRLPAVDVKPGDLAFPSMQKAYSRFLEDGPPPVANRP